MIAITYLRFPFSFPPAHGPSCPLLFRLLLHPVFRLLAGSFEVGADEFGIQGRVGFDHGLGEGFVDGAAGAKLGELFKEAQYASDEDKKGMAKQFEEIQLEVRTATKTAMMAADADITDDVADKVLDAAEERMKQRRQQFQQNGKKK